MTDAAIIEGEARLLDEGERSLAPVVDARADARALVVRYVGAYIDSLGLRASKPEQSRAAMRSKLRSLARLVFDELDERERLLVFSTTERDDVDEHAIAWHELDEAGLARLVRALDERFAASTAHVTICALRGALRKARALGAITRDDLDDKLEALSYQASTDAPESALDADAVERLLAACDDSTRGRRDAVVVALLAFAGLRRGELVALEVDDVSSDAVFVRSGKGRKARRIPKAQRLAAILERWLERRGRAPGALLCPVSRHDTVSRELRPLSLEAIRYVLDELAARAGVERDFASHDGRRFFATQLARQGEHVSTIRALLGHADISTTLRYIDVDDEQKRDAIRRLDASLATA